MFKKLIIGFAVSVATASMAMPYIVRATSAEAAIAETQCANFKYQQATTPKPNFQLVTSDPAQTSVVWSGNHTFLPGTFCIKVATSGRNFYLTYQTDGNLVLYSTTGVPQWATGTSGTGHSLIFQSDRNIVIYNQSGNAVWAASNWWTLPRSAPMTSTDDWWNRFDATQSQQNWYFTNSSLPANGEYSNELKINVTDPGIWVGYCQILQSSRVKIKTGADTWYYDYSTDKVLWNANMVYGARSIY